MSTIPRALTIAGSDSGGGAGIQADLKTFLALGVHGMSAVTAITVQNTVGVSGVHEVPAELVRSQIEAVVGDIGTDAAKTGMLSSSPIVETVAEAVAELGVANVVCDTVFVSKHGSSLLHPDAVEALRTKLIPLATVITPNVPEAEGLLGRPIPDDEPLDDAAAELIRLGPRWVLLKGGHRQTGDATDVLTDGHQVLRFSLPRVATPHTHGTGCVLSAAIAAGLAQGLDVPAAVDQAKTFVHRAIQRHLPIGHGIGPVNPAHAIWR